MVSVKKLSIVSLVISIIFLSLSFVLNPGITGFAVLEDALNEYAFDIFSLIFIVGIVISLLGVYYGVKIENDLQEELSMFNIGVPNISITGLREYIDYNLSEGRDESDIKSTLLDVGWDENLVNETFEEVKD